ncbi:hypothetical protein PsorP6_006076 [Peronosclerospora sorghi]|uniref:Uncharacterized protein n=1 Tax=Peronosclerospora sorghi TaxID=230839 RepID=A0ACC0W1M3_9STRA|nr:hypothetical protein PsorP6_006076 [Peronosclerospora sorghi]
MVYVSNAHVCPTNQRLVEYFDRNPLEKRKKLLSRLILKLYEYLRNLNGLPLLIRIHPSALIKCDILIPISNKPELFTKDDYSNDKLLQKNLFSNYFTKAATSN